MPDYQHFDQWLRYAEPTDAVDIKVEAHMDHSSLLSPPSSPYIGQSPANVTPSSAPARRRRSPISGLSQRVRPYPIPRDVTSRTDDLSIMSGSPYTYSSSRGNHSRAVDRRSSDGDQPMYNSGLSDPTFSTTSYSPGMMDWSQTQHTSHTDLYPGVSGNVSFSSPSGAPYEGHDSIAQDSRSQAYYDPYTTPASSRYPQMSSPSTYSTSSPEGSAHDDVQSLQFRLRELEEINRQDKERIRQLELRLSHTPPGSAGITPPSSASFQASWVARTEARKRLFCAPNRAGNALCAWHDTRRERRAYPPRMAPEGYLNCGCTYEEALFEESLSRNGVGSYLPGDNVRMDPALRNPLLKLLQSRYGYQDGDFERDRRTGEWVSGEGHTRWEQELGSGVRRSRSERQR
ncbi:hypothetical protein Moror_10734 [Moniliophthora roreri MCA 2997]|uniref:Uncharacterized protein n=2 Tax=Moniliophthora roreri TaxID=221103 RepID=V2X5M2_MONRO|nr:hypothetical protein Moror_10734 [Moniliophthora roreri MCA 2997]KAI3614010.1 hypothetical protein WG66_010700 [Moniliophthora roreri]